MGRLQNNPSIGWVHPKSTHARLSDCGNKNLKDLEKISLNHVMFVQEAANI
jgi:hypothetical protein